MCDTALYILYMWAQVPSSRVIPTGRGKTPALPPRFPGGLWGTYVRPGPAVSEGDLLQVHLSVQGAGVYLEVSQVVVHWYFASRGR